MRYSMLNGLLTALLMNISLVSAQPIGDGILSDLDIYAGAECEPEIAVVNMNIPVRYISHFPRQEGRQVRIRIRPLAVSELDRRMLDERESRAPAFRRATLLREATFEGDIAGGPFLSLRFRENTHFQIFQGLDYRSIWIVISPASYGEDSPCQRPAGYNF